MQMQKLFLYVEVLLAPMNKPLSINELLDHLPDFVGQDVSVRDMLHFGGII